MTAPMLPVVDQPHIGRLIRLRTLISLRWIAIVGQVAAIAIAHAWFGLKFDLGLSFLAIGVSIIANLIITFIYPASKRLSERELLFMLLFDITQLAALLFITGGLNNPFALLIMAPVAIAASVLRPLASFAITLLAAALTGALALFHMPLRSQSGTVVELPLLFQFGYWAAITIGILFLGAYARRIMAEMRGMSDALLAAQMALDREQKLTDLSGVVAAMAHELGTPLATIKLAGSELLDDLAQHPDLREDARLILEQADRCRDILHSMGRAGKDDLMMRHTPLCALVQEASQPHTDRGIEVNFSPDPANCGLNPKPIVWRRAEIIHGLRNLIQNAVDFAETKVWVETLETDSTITIRIIDDGRGFPPQILGRLGDPYVTLGLPSSSLRKRPGYKGMGLGLFIAKTLLERTGAELTFDNGREAGETEADPGGRHGAIVEVTWKRDLLCVDEALLKGGLGDNEMMENL